MSTDNQFNIPQGLRSIAETSVEQARKAFDSFLDAAGRMAGAVDGQSQAFREETQNLGLRAMSFAEKNIMASLDYAERLIRAKDVAEITRLHSAYVQEQIKVLAEQARELGQVVTKSEDSTRPK